MSLALFGRGHSRRKPTMQKENILSVEEFAFILGISAVTVKMLAKAGDIPCFYKNRRPYFYFDVVINHFMKIEGGAV